MYDHIGGKIKIIAKLYVWIGIALVILIFGSLLKETREPVCLLYMIGGAFLVWLSSFPLYGLGEIIERLVQIDENTRPK